MHNLMPLPRGRPCYGYISTKRWSLKHGHWTHLVDWLLTVKLKTQQQVEIVYSCFLKCNYIVSEEIREKKKETQTYWSV